MEARVEQQSKLLEHPEFTNRLMNRVTELGAEIATLRADGTKAAEELSQTREALRAQATGAAGQARRNIALADELARERERHQLAIAKLQQTEPWNNSQHVEDLIDEAIALLEPKAETAPASAAQEEK